jgi:hypothetical protein
MLWCLHAEQKLLRLADNFDKEGIGFAVLKGPALAHTVYAEPCIRPFGDLDLLVRSLDYDNACTLLARLGHVRLRPEPRPGWEATFGKASVHVHPEDGVEVDLHRTLVLGPIGQWINGDELMDHRSTFQLGGRDIPCLDDTGTLVNVALHASLGWAQPLAAPVRDTVQVDQKGTPDQDRLTSWVEEWHLAAALSLTNNIVQTRCGCSCRVLALLRLEKTRRDERILKAYTERRSAGRLPMTTLWAIRGFTAKARYSSALAFPDRRFLRHRGPAAGRSGPLSRLDRLLGWVRSSRSASVRTHGSRLTR